MRDEEHGMTQHGGAVLHGKIPGVDGLAVLDGNKGFLKLSAQPLGISIEIEGRLIDLTEFKPAQRKNRQPTTNRKRPQEQPHARLFPHSSVNTKSSKSMGVPEKGLPQSEARPP